MDRSRSVPVVDELAGVWNEEAFPKDVSISGSVTVGRVSTVTLDEVKMVASDPGMLIVDDDSFGETPAGVVR